jgi:hypothetical protein
LRSAAVLNHCERDGPMERDSSVSQGETDEHWLHYYCHGRERERERERPGQRAASASPACLGVLKTDARREGVQWGQTGIIDGRARRAAGQSRQPPMAEVRTV